jgi:hypothetical protein
MEAPVRATLSAVAIATGAFAALDAPALRAQDIICCNQLISAHGDWFGAIRVDNCQDWFNRIPFPTLEHLCGQRSWLTCIDTSRCDTLPAKDAPKDKDAAPGTNAPPLPPDPDRDGVADGFGSPPPSTTTAPPAGGVSPPRLVYLVRARSSGGGAPLTAFTVYLDRDACAVPLDANGQPRKSSAPERVVRGRVVRADGRVRVEAEAASMKDGTSLAQATGEAPGDGRSAVAAAARAAARQLRLVCAR